MKKNLILFIALTWLIISPVLVAEPVNVTGKWEMTLETPRGERTRVIEFVQDGEKLKVKFHSENGAAENGQPHQKRIKNNQQPIF